ncbi:hypothetical protein DPMN_173387 [Dreissena polymorpha]|uniref:Kinesin motor domain-containing protein n=1 Tax=Dreissena polymorpha TaxID=45954 RepID=A0A9D4IFG3_DREPO|nr:hypothetical protein DPMN_173387 [Dreissena polymorpha]
MDETGEILTPGGTASRYELRPRTPSTPKRSGTPSTPTARKILRSSNTPDNVPRDLTTPLKSAQHTPSNLVQRTPRTPKTEEKTVFRTPMTFKPRIVGSRVVPSPSRAEIWRQQLGLEEADESDKENPTSSDEEENKQNVAPLVEFRALQKELATKDAQRDECLLLIKNCKEKNRLYKARLEREETTKRQQLRILRKTHESQLQEKEQFIATLQAIVNEQEERIRELEEVSVSTPRSKRATRSARNAAPDPAPTAQASEHLSKLVDDVRRLQSQNGSLMSQLNDVQIELTNVREEHSREIDTLQDSVEKTRSLTNGSDLKKSSQHICCSHSSQVSVLERQCTDLQTERLQLLQDLTEAHNNNTKATTVSKLANHRQQQLEDEVKRLKSRCAQLEGESTARSNRGDDLTSVREEVATLTQENNRLQQNNRELQLQVMTLQTKSPEVVTVTKKVESESLRQRFEAVKSENELLKHTCDARKQELHEAQNQVRYLEKMLSVTETAKKKADSDLWSELESLHSEHQAATKALRDQMEADKHDAVQEIQAKLTTEHKDELQAIVQGLKDKHQHELQESEEKMCALKVQYEQLASKFEMERGQILSKMEEEKFELLSRLEEEKEALKEEMITQLKLFEENMLKLEHKCKLENRQLEEDLMIAKTAAVNRVREELQLEKQVCLSALEEKLKEEHEDEIEKLTINVNNQIVEAVEQERRSTSERMVDLENKYGSLVRQLVSTGPVLAHFVESYILLQKEVKRLPKIIEKTVSGVTQQVMAAILGVSEHNKELVHKYQKEMKLRKKYHNELVELKGNIRVFCRVRPLIREDGSGSQAEDIVTLDQDDSGVLYINSKGRTQTFDVDRVFGEGSTQQEVFDEVKALITSCIDGYNVCIFAYGQTGSGKTYTMEGTSEDPGINQRALSLLFEETGARRDWEYTISVSVLEIYNEMIRDLLGDDVGYKMEVKMNPDGGYHIPGLCYVHVKTVGDVNECFRVGQLNRATAVNQHELNIPRGPMPCCV